MVPKLHKKHKIGAPTNVNVCGKKKETLFGVSQL